MEKIKVITNNPLVKENYSHDISTEYYDVSYIELLEIIRDKIHLGSKLLTHPLSGSVKPNETPYKTVVISYDNVLHMDSLLMIEQSIETTKKFLKNKPPLLWSDNVLKDCQIVDLSLIGNVLENIL